MCYTSINTNIYVSSYLALVSILLYMCPHTTTMCYTSINTTIYVSSYLALFRLRAMSEAIFASICLIFTTVYFYYYTTRYVLIPCFSA